VSEETVNPLAAQPTEAPVAEQVEAAPAAPAEPVATTNLKEFIGDDLSFKENIFDKLPLEEGENVDKYKALGDKFNSVSSLAKSYLNLERMLSKEKMPIPTDNDGDALIIGALYFNTTTAIMYVYSASGWVAAGSSVNGTSDRVTYTATGGQTTFAATYDVGYVDTYLNGIKLLAGTDFTATSGTAITLTVGATAGDIIDIVAYGSFSLADHYTKTQSDARYALADDALALAIALG